ncbi:MAG: M28 family peptidase [Ignavibacteria bacterium]|nr:M28 family peptidase [Ignavibacteria bacterium]
MKQFTRAIGAYCIFYAVFASFIYPQNTKIALSDAARRMQSSIEYLASDELQGRLTGTRECMVAAEYIKKTFIQAGLQPVPGNDFFQTYSFVAGAELQGVNELYIKSGQSNIKLQTGEFIPASFSGSGHFEGECVFAGYGITAPKLHYDDYDNLNVTGKFVIAFRSHPDYMNPRSDFEEYASYRYKAKVALDKGAKGLILINPPHPSAEDALPQFKYDRAPAMKNFPVIFLKRERAEILTNELGFSFAALQDSITHLKKAFPVKALTSKMVLDVHIALIEKNGVNVIGRLEGTDPSLKDEYVVIGAHFDHLGFGDEGSLYRGPEKLIHHGADDNASGTAGVLELANQFGKAKLNKRSILFICFSGEELGLLGSAYYVKNSFVPVKQVVSMLNLDMVGRLNTEKSLIVYGTGTAGNFKKLTDSLNAPYKFKLSQNDDGYGPSDQASFYGEGIPVLFFFTGVHEDYHRPSDVASRINASGEDSVLMYVADIARAISSNPERPVYVNVPKKGSDKGNAWKVYVGTVPDFAFQGDGFKISAVNEGSPAQKGGMKSGDIMISFGGKKIANIYDYVYALKNCVPGDAVEVIVKRGEQELKLTVVMGMK